MPLLLRRGRGQVVHSQIPLAFPANVVDRLLLPPRIELRSAERLLLLLQALLLQIQLRLEFVQV